MKIRAIRLRDVGGFTDPVALDGLSGGLDVLAGPNELGKSTILKALQALFLVGHKSKAVSKWPLIGLQPIGGGSPLIEAEFEVDGKAWRLRKQFLSGASACLSDLQGGNQVLRGAEADERALQFINARAGAATPIGLLWVGQKASLQAIEPSRGEKAALRSLVEQEIQNVSDGGRTRAIRDAVTAQLAELFTEKSLIAKNPRVRAHSPFDLAIKKRDAIATDLEHARQQGADAASRLEALQDLREREQALAGTEAGHLRAKQVKEAGAALKTADAAREEMRLAAIVLEKHQGEQRAADKALTEIDTALDELAKLEAAQTKAAPLLQELKSALQQADAAAAASKKQRETCQSDLKAAGTALKLAEHAEKRRLARASLGAMQQKLTDAQTAAKALNSAAAEMEQCHVSEGGVQAVRREAGAIATIEAQLSAAAPKVSIAYAEGGAGKIKVGGDALADGAQLEPGGRLQLSIDGIGTITIEPGGLDDLGDLRADGQSKQEQLDHLLAKMGAADPADAENKLAARRAIEARISEAGARLSALAPQGLETLVDEMHRLDALADKHGPDDAVDDPQPREALQRRHDELEMQRATWDANHERQRADAANLKADLAGREAEATALKDRLETLTAMLPEAGRREALREARAKTRADAERAVNAARRDLLDWSEKLGDDVKYAAAATRLKEAQAAQAEAQADVARVREAMKEIEGALGAYAEDGVETRIAELTGRLAVAVAEIARIENDADALRLLDDVLAEAESTTREKFLQPVMQRVAPYLELMLPGAALQMDDELKVEGLQRGGARQPLSIISVGTQEQIAVMVRLGFGRLLADTGAPAPLILDDALVYSDDERIARAFEALELAARHHQVIVLTCRSRSFEPLGGKRLELTPWQVAPP